MTEDFYRFGDGSHLYQGQCSCWPKSQVNWLKSISNLNRKMQLCDLGIALLMISLTLSFIKSYSVYLKEGIKT